MQFPANSVSGKFSYHSVTAAFAVILNSETDMSDSVASFSLIDTYIKRLLCCLQQSQHRFVNFANRESITTVSVVTIENGSTVESDNVSIFEHVVRRETMNYFIVDFNTKRSREPVISFETRNCSMVTDKLFSNLIKSLSRNTWLDPLG